MIQLFQKPNLDFLAKISWLPWEGLTIYIFFLNSENLGAEDPRCPLAGLTIPESRGCKVYGEAHCSDKFKV